MERMGFNKHHLATELSGGSVHGDASRAMYELDAGSLADSGLRSEFGDLHSPRSNSSRTGGVPTERELAKARNSPSPGSNGEVETGQNTAMGLASIAQGLKHAIASMAESVALLAVRVCRCGAAAEDGAAGNRRAEDTAGAPGRSGRKASRSWQSWSTEQVLRPGVRASMRILYRLGAASGMFRNGWDGESGW